MPENNQEKPKNPVTGVDQQLTDEQIRQETTLDDLTPPGPGNQSRTPGPRDGS